MDDAMTHDRENFLKYVRDYVTADPEAAPYVAQAASAGVSAALREALHRAADMETALAVAIAKRHKGADALIHDKLKQWEGKTSLNWTGILKGKAHENI
jgi:hypothetical protein